MRSRTIALAMAVAFAWCGTIWLTPSSADNPSKEQLGKKIANVSFVDTTGKTIALHDLKGKKAIVVVFLSFECPVSNSYSAILSDMAREFASHDIAFVGLTTNQDETAEQIAKQVKDNNLNFPVGLDKNYAFADALKAGTTPEAFVLDGDCVLRYRGRIDNGYYARLKKSMQVTRHDLHQVLSEIASGRPLSVTATEPIGCPIRRAAVAAPVVGKVTYYKDVLPILQNNCQQCHRPGEVGPFSLMTYRQAVNWAGDIKDFTQSRRMPPWKVSAGMEFHNERRLSDKEIATLAAWVDANTPEGDPKDAPAAMEFKEGWRLGQPDLVLTMSDEFQLGPNGDDLFRCFVMPTNLTEDKWVTAVEVRPGNPRIVHHSILYIDNKGMGRKLEKAQATNPLKDPHKGSEFDKGPGYYGGMGVGFVPAGSLGGWAPGQLPRELPHGSAIFLPKNSDVVMQLHYHRDGRLARDRTQVGIYFAKNKVERRYQGGYMMGFFFSIPKNKDNFVVKGTIGVTEDMELYDIMPHMHMLGKKIKVTVTPPQGQTQLVFDIPEWDYNWQETYHFKQPLKLKAGARIDLEAVYDNSAKNLNNPFNPPRDVVFGEQTFDEMCFVFFGGVSQRKGDELPLGKLTNKPNN